MQLIASAQWRTINHIFRSNEINCRFALLYFVFISIPLWVAFGTANIGRQCGACSVWIARDAFTLEPDRETKLKNKIMQMETINAGGRKVGQNERVSEAEHVFHFIFDSIQFSAAQVKFTPTYGNFNGA